jgi:hypothetical protein
MGFGATGVVAWQYAKVASHGRLKAKDTRRDMTAVEKVRKIHEISEIKRLTAEGENI